MASITEAQGLLKRIEEGSKPTFCGIDQVTCTVSYQPHASVFIRKTENSLKKYGPLLKHFSHTKNLRQQTSGKTLGE